MILHTFLNSLVGLPMITLPLPTNTEVEHGLPFTLTCTAENDPAVPQELSFLWEYNGMEVVGDSRVIIMTMPEDVNNIATSRLIFSPALQSDTGNYTCLVHNRQIVDAVSSTTYFNVTGEHSLVANSIYLMNILLS